MNNLDKNKKIFVAMSGGVDSSVVAGLLKEQGYDVVGVTMCFNISHPGDSKPSCCGVAGIQDAQRAAQILNIPHYVFNFAKDIDEKIIDNFTDEYLNGRTPNPCVQCNQHLKFGSLYNQVRALGADVLATGHYARLEKNSSTGHVELKKGHDPKKDQSYFLYSMRRETLPHVWMPIGSMTKQEVRQLAHKYKLNTADKAESQDICFVPSTGYKKFIEDRVGTDVIKTPGPFVDETGKVVGQHQGIIHYTIGQRDKLGMALGHPVYVYKIDKTTNTVYVGNLSKLYSSGLIASRMNYLSIDPPLTRFKVEVRIRYSPTEVVAYLTTLEDGKARVEFDEPQKSVTPGQSVVFYHGDVVLAGGIIEEPLACPSDKIPSGG